MINDPNKGYYEKVGFFRVWRPYEKEAIKVSDEYLYIIKTPFGSKIGMSRDPETRIKGLVGALPFREEYSDYFLVDNAKIKENYFHSKYLSKKIKGEWFDLSDKEIENIRKEIQQWVKL